MFIFEIIPLVIHHVNPSTSGNIPYYECAQCVRYACVLPDFRQVSWDYRIHFTLVILSYVRPSTSHGLMQPTYTDTEHTFWEQITKNMSIFFFKETGGAWNLKLLCQLWEHRADEFALTFYSCELSECSRTSRT